MIAHGQMATLAEAGQPGNKGLSRGVIQAERGKTVRCSERQVHTEGKDKLRRTGWHGAPGSGPHSQGSRRSLAMAEGPICVICQQGG